MSRDWSSASTPAAVAAMAPGPISAGTGPNPASPGPHLGSVEHELLGSLNVNLGARWGCVGWGP